MALHDFVVEKLLALHGMELAAETIKLCCCSILDFVLDIGFGRKVVVLIVFVVDFLPLCLWLSELLVEFLLIFKFLLG